MTVVRTLVYFDLEATGLKSSGKPRICELSLIAVNVQDVLEMTENVENRIIESKIFQVRKRLPRIMNKLTLCVYPMATIVPLVSDITGLDNYNLTGQSKFDMKTVNLINSFLLLLPPPLCLVAHNGNDYDFPLLKAEVDKTGKSLSSDILCADSYIGIKEIFKKRKEIKRVKNEERLEVDWKEEENIVKVEMDATKDLINEGVLESELTEGTYNPFEAENELTPKSVSCNANTSFTPKKQKQFAFSDKFEARKKLRFSNPDEPISFSLINLHKHVLGYPPEQSHGAEADCISLMRTTAALGIEWINWVKGNCYKFESCKRMWGQSKVQTSVIANIF